MKRLNKALYAIGIMLGMVEYCQADVQPFNLDQLYPKSGLTQATEQCVHIWGAFDRLLTENVSSVSFTKTIDRSIGQLVLAHHYLQSAAPAGAKNPHIEQVHYLARVVGTIEGNLASLSNLDTAQRACLKECLEKVKKLVEKKIEKQ